MPNQNFWWPDAKTEKKGSNIIQYLDSDLGVIAPDQRGYIKNLRAKPNFNIQLSNMV